MLCHMVSLGSILTLGVVLDRDIIGLQCVVRKGFDSFLHMHVV